MESVDRKFTILATSKEHGRNHTEVDSVLFLAKDKAFLPTLRFYYRECADLGADQRQLEGIALLIARVERWQREHPEAMKVADVDQGPAGDAIVAPNEAE